MRVPARVAGAEMERAEAELEAARRNASDKRRTRLEFYAFDPSAGLADDAWEVTMRLRRDRSVDEVVVAATPETVPPPTEPEYHPPTPEITDSSVEPSYEPAPAITERHETAPPRPVDDRFEPDPPPPPGPEPDLLVEPASEPATAPAPRRERRPRRTGRVRPDVARIGGVVRDRRDRRRRQREELGLEPPTFLERLSVVVGTALITVAVLWIGLVVAIVVMLGSTSSTGLALTAAGMVVGFLAAGLGVLIRRA